MSFVQSFQEMKRIYGFCPCCSAPFRLSDATLRTRKTPPKTVFDELEDARDRLDLKRERFAALEDSIRARSRDQGRKALRERLGVFLPCFIKREVSLVDVKVLFHPIDYIVFHGKDEGRCLSVDFMDRPAESLSREKLHESLFAAIQHSRLEWQTYRITDDGRVTLDSRGRRRNAR